VVVTQRPGLGPTVAVFDRGDVVASASV